MGTTPGSQVIAVANLKGGVGKSTTVLNVAGFAAQAGKRVLVIDADPQASVTRIILPQDAAAPLLLSAAFQARAKTLDGVRVPSTLHGVDLVPSDLSFDVALQQAVNWPAREYVLQAMLAPHLDAYDLVLIDCRPGIDLSVLNALAAATWMLIPVECSFMALDGYEHVRVLAQTVRDLGINPALTLLGLLPTKYHRTTSHDKQALERIAVRAHQEHAALHFAPIRTATAAADAPARSMSLAEYAPTSAVAGDYRQATAQIIAFLEAHR